MLQDQLYSQRSRQRAKYEPCMIVRLTGIMFCSLNPKNAATVALNSLKRQALGLRLGFGAVRGQIQPTFQITFLLRQTILYFKVSFFFDSTVPSRHIA